MLRLRPSTASAIRAGFSASTSATNFLLSVAIRRFGSLGRWERSAMRGAFGLLLCSLLPAATESAVANGDTRTLNLYNAHTHESIQATYRVDGQYDPAVLEKLNWFLRDWRRNESTHMDPRLFDAVWETYREAGATTPIRVVCGYRSPQTNAMLRRRSRAVAEHSQHMLGKAMDTEMPGMSMEKIREVAMRLQMGGVGFYGDASFVHIDVGNVRYWPRMTYAQLARVFPDGKTVLIPTNGKPLPGYEEARANLASAGRVAQVQPPQPGRPNLLAWLFGGGKSADESEEEAAQQVAAAPDASPPVTQVAVAETAAAAVHETDSKDEVALVAENLPIPPHRPDEFMALADLAPLPPNRPAPIVAASAKALPAKAMTDPIGALLKASTPATRVADLPAIITHGSSKGSSAPQTDSRILAYAPMAQMEGLRSAVQGDRVRKAVKPAAFSPAARPRLPHAVQIAKTEANIVLAPTLTGLRQAARIETVALSQKLAAGYLARFSTVASNLPTDRFSGPAIVGLRSADRSRMVFVDRAVALNKGH